MERDCSYRAKAAGFKGLCGRNTKLSSLGRFWPISKAASSPICARIGGEGDLPGSRLQPVAPSTGVPARWEDGDKFLPKFRSEARRRGRAGGSFGHRAWRRPPSLPSPRGRRAGGRLPGVGEMRGGPQPPRRAPSAPGTRPGAPKPGRVRPSARPRPCARRRHGDGHKTPAPGAPANGSARRGGTRTSLFQDGGASVASSRAGGKPAEPSRAAARDGTEAAVATVGGGPGSFRCCCGCCHAARLGRTSLPRGVMMLTEVSGAQCLPARRASGRRQPVPDAAPGAGPDLLRGPARPARLARPARPPGSHKCHRVGAVLTRQSSTSSGRRSCTVPAPRCCPAAAVAPRIPPPAPVPVPGLRGPSPAGIPGRHPGRGSRPERSCLPPASPLTARRSEPGSSSHTREPRALLLCPHIPSRSCSLLIHPKVQIVIHLLD